MPRTLVWDGEGAIGRWRHGKTELTGECQAFRGTLGAKVLVLKPREPEHKGIIERAHDYLETSFLPGPHASPARPTSTPSCSTGSSLVNARRRRVLGCAPTERIAADKAAMLALPPVAPATGWRASTRLARDHYVRIDSNDYSIHPAVIGRRIELIVDLHRVRAFCDGRARRRPRAGLGLAPDHQRPRPPRRRQGAAPGARRRAAPGHRLTDLTGLEVEQRCLADYDTALGLDNAADGGVA